MIVSTILIHDVQDVKLFEISTNLATDSSTVGLITAKFSLETLQSKHVPETSGEANLDSDISVSSISASTAQQPTHPVSSDAALTSTIVFNVTVDNCEELYASIPGYMSESDRDGFGTFPIDYPPTIAFNNSVATLTLQMHNVYFRQRTFSCMVNIFSHPKKIVPIHFTFERDYFDSTFTRMRRAASSCTIDEVLNGTACYPVDCFVKYWGTKNFFNTTLRLCTSYNLCPSGYLLDVSTNLCATVNVTAPDVPEIPLPVTAIDVDLNGPKCECNHGTLDSSQQCFCNCDPGWTTEPGQDPQKWVWCNRSIDSYYTPTNPNGTAQVSAAGVTIIVLFVLGLILLIGGCCYCCRTRLRLCCASLMRRRWAPHRRSTKKPSEPHRGLLQADSPLKTAITGAAISGVSRRAPESVIAGDIGLASTAPPLVVTAAKPVYGSRPPPPPPPPTRTEIKLSLPIDGKTDSHCYNFLEPRVVMTRGDGKTCAMASEDSSPVACAEDKPRVKENVYSGDLANLEIPCKSFVEYVTADDISSSSEEENEVHYDNPKPCREKIAAKQPKPSADMFVPGYGLFWLMGLGGGSKTITSDI